MAFTVLTDDRNRASGELLSEYFTCDRVGSWSALTGCHANGQLPTYSVLYKLIETCSFENLVDQFSNRAKSVIQMSSKRSNECFDSLSVRSIPRNSENFFWDGVSRLFDRLDVSAIVELSDCVFHSTRKRGSYVAENTLDLSKHLRLANSAALRLRKQLFNKPRTRVNISADKLVNELIA